MTDEQKKEPIHPALRVHEALKVFGLVDESSRGALEHVVLGLMQESVDRVVEALNRYIEARQRAASTVGEARLAEARRVVDEMMKGG